MNDQTKNPMLQFSQQRDTWEQTVLDLQEQIADARAQVERCEAICGALATCGICKSDDDVDWNGDHVSCAGCGATATVDMSAGTVTSDDVTWVLQNDDLPF